MDTENKRRSAVGLYGVRTVPPVPDSTPTAVKRRHSVSLYALEAAAGRGSFWIPVELNSDPGWKQDTDTGQTWVGDGDGSTSWQPVYKVDD